MKIHSLNVPFLKAHSLIYRTLMRGRSDLSRVQREMIALEEFWRDIPEENG